MSWIIIISVSLEDINGFNLNIYNLYYIYIFICLKSCRKCDKPDVQSREGIHAVGFTLFMLLQPCRKMLAPKVRVLSAENWYHIGKELRASIVF